jgi:hypothetical protein
MDARRMKRFGMSTTAVALLFALAALAGGCATQCALYDCLNRVVLTGSVVLPKEVSVVDFRFCAENKCNEGSIDLLDGNARVPCASWDLTGSKVCLNKKAGEPDSFAVDAESSPFPEREDPPEVSVQLRLVDHATGEVLLDETRTAKSQSSSNNTDDCHECWGATATL